MEISPYKFQDELAKVSKSLDRIHGYIARCHAIGDQVTSNPAIADGLEYQIKKANELLGEENIFALRHFADAFPDLVKYALSAQRSLGDAATTVADKVGNKV